VRKKVVMSKDEFIMAIRQGMYPGYAVRKHSSGEYPFSTRDKFKFNNLGQDLTFLINSFFHKNSRQIKPAEMVYLVKNPERIE